MMIEWNVYRSGEYLGTVLARNETQARLAALCKWGFDDEDSLSVSRR